MKLYVNRCTPTILVACTSLLWFKCLGLTITAEDFTWKLIENTLNATTSTENFVVAPSEAYRLHRQIFATEAESNENDTSEEAANHKHQYLSSVVLPAVTQQQKTIASSYNGTNHNELRSSVSLTARWAFNFQTRDTHKRVFHQLGTEREKTWVDFLRKDDTFYYSHDEQLNASILELPLNVKKIKFLIILPDQWDGLQAVKDYLLENMTEFKELVKSTRKMILVRVLLPKFQLTYKQNLMDFFAETSSRKVENYQNVCQVTNLEFNERGIGHFERTTVLFWNAYSYLRVTPTMFDVNHPFLFLITNDDGIQFFGQVVQTAV